MEPEIRERGVRWQQLKSSVTFVSLASISVILLLVVLASAVWRAFTSGEPAPTPTIPPYVEPNYAYVSALEGDAVSLMADTDVPTSLEPGALIAAGPDAVVRVPAAGWLRLGFVNGATVYVGEASEIELRQIADSSEGMLETIIRLNRGRVLATDGEENLTMIVRAPTMVEARGFGNALLGVTYEATSESFELHCLEETCLLAGPAIGPHPVGAGSYRSIMGERGVSAAQPLRYEQFRGLGDPGMVPTVTPGAPMSTPVGETVPTATRLAATTTPTPSPSPTATPSRTPTPVLLGAAPGVPSDVIAAAQDLATVQPAEFAWTADPAEAAVTLVVGAGEPLASWIYAVAAPFSTVTDTVPLSTLQAAWQGQGEWPLIVAEPVVETLATLWDEPAPAVQIVDGSDLVDRTWAAQPARTIVPFPGLEPRLKVLAVESAGVPRSPLDREFDANAYPLALTIGVTGTEIGINRLFAAWEGPRTNRRPDRLTQVALTGSSGLGRTVANRMARLGPTYPGEEVAPLLRSVDFAHLSNEVPFAPDCPPFQPASVIEFCAPPSYVELMTYVGADINEMTGNHVNDWGEDNLQFTLDLYDEVGIETYGGGHDLAAARQPLLLEHNGNRLAFVGCNPAGPFNAWAGPDYAGARPCDYGFPQLQEQIRELKKEGYQVIATLQYLENYSYAPVGRQASDFHALAQAGADVVSGSQSHQPQGFAFGNGAFIHYGLGNLFFDQMDRLATRQSFIDIHTFYAGRLLSVELWTGFIEDYARPRPMTAAERAQLLEVVFQGSDWNR